MKWTFGNHLRGVSVEGDVDSCTKTVQICSAALLTPHGFKEQKVVCTHCDWNKTYLRNPLHQGPEHEKNKLDVTQHCPVRLDRSHRRLVKTCTSPVNITITCQDNGCLLCVELVILF